MANIISIIIGVIALILALLAFIPLLGWANWIIIPIALIGVGIGFFSDKTSGRNFGLFVVVICVLRLWLGGGLI